MPQKQDMFYASVILSGICILMFVFQLVFGTGTFVLDTSKAWQEPWRLVTAVFSHGGVGHLLSNLFALLLFGLILEGRIGSKKMIWVFLISGIAINIIVSAFNLYNLSLGASGAIFSILGILVVLRPRLTVWVSGIPVPMFVAGIVWAVQDALGVFAPSGIANLAHLLGLFFGLILGWWWNEEYGDRHERKERRKGKDALDQELDDWENRNMR